MKYFIIILSLLINHINKLEAKINIFTCEPEWGLLVKEITLDQADISVGVYAKQNPHFIQAKPSLIAKVKNADLILCTGADLEAGWLPMLLEKSGSKAPILYLYESVEMIDKVSVDQIDRKNGDVHPYGNPHIHFDPNNIEKIALDITKKLIAIDKQNELVYQSNYNNFVIRWKKARIDWENKSKYLKGVKVVFHHKDFNYLAKWLELNVVGYLEEKSGIDPSASYLLSMVNKIKNSDVRLIIRAPYSSSKASIFIGEKTNIKHIVLPYSLDFNLNNTIFDLYNNTLNILIEEVAKT
jgi:zinc/manganese transport system substrate-binding protein